MTELTRDTDTAPHAGDDTQEGEYADVLPFGDPAAAFLPEFVELPGPTIDPTRVRLTGLRAAEWKEEAACAGKAYHDDDPWHPGGDGREGHFTPRARLTCIGCPVRLQCLALGLALLPLGRVWGMYAGYTPAELQQIARARGMASRIVAQHGTRARYVTGCECSECKRAHREYVAVMRAEERYAETTLDTPIALPESVPTVTALADLFSLLDEDEDPTTAHREAS